MNTVKDGKEDTDEDGRHLPALAMRGGLGWGAAGLHGDTSASLSRSSFFSHFEAKQPFGESPTHFQTLVKLADIYALISLA